MSSALDTVVGIRILKLLSTPIQKSKAFQLGIINDQGKKLRNNYTCTSFLPPYEEPSI